MIIYSYVQYRIKKGDAHMESYPELKDVPEEELIDLAELFKMFADSTRIKILY